MKTESADLNDYVEAIRSSGFSIYHPIEVGHPVLWIPTPDLEQLLNSSITGASLAGLPLRTRSKVVKTHICRALGYPVPSSFKKTQPRFPGQFFDTYVQKSNNLQIWNEELAPTRRYVIVQVNIKDVITQVKVVTGEVLARLDSTGTATRKHQARLIPGNAEVELIAEEDTKRLRPLVYAGANLKKVPTPLDYPQGGQLLPIKEILRRLRPLVGKSFPDFGSDQERNRGMALHRMVCMALGFSSCRDSGQFPDIRHQLLEVKLQTSPTIDLGLASPDSEDILDLPMIAGRYIRYCDVRYVIFHATSDGQYVTLKQAYLTTGQAFFKRFRRFQGNVVNRKLQVPLPSSFFNE